MRAMTQEVVASPRVHRDLDLAQHVLERDHPAPRGVAAFFRELLVLDLNRGDPRRLVARGPCGAR